MAKRRRKLSPRERYAGPTSTGGPLKWREVAIQDAGKQWEAGDGRAWMDSRGWFRVMVYSRFGGISLGEKHIDASRRLLTRQASGEIRWPWVPVGKQQFRQTSTAFAACEQLALEIAEEMAEERPPKPPPPRKRSAKQKPAPDAGAQIQNPAPPLPASPLPNFRPRRIVRR